MDLPRPFEVLEAFGGKSKWEAPRAFKFCAKWVPTKVNNWWKFGVYISNQLWDIQIWKFFFFKVPQTRYKNSFWKLASDLDFPPKASKTSNGRGRFIFWATPFKFGEISFLSKLYKCWNFCSATSNGVEISKISVECSVHILRRPWAEPVWC